MVAVTVAPGTTAPVGSVTVPAMDPAVWENNKLERLKVHASALIFSSFITCSLDSREPARARFGVYKKVSLREMHPICSACGFRSGAGDSLANCGLFALRSAVVCRRKEPEEAVSLIVYTGGEEQPIAGSSGMVVAEA